MRHDRRRHEALPVSAMIWNMTQRKFQLQPVVQRKLASLGTVGQRWLAELPGLVAELEKRWSISVGESLPGGSASFVAKARTRDGGEVVLKLVIPQLDGAGEVSTLVRARGRGYVQLHEYDASLNAMLQEPLGPAMDRLDWSAEQVIETLCLTLRQAWTVPIPSRSAKYDKARELAELVADLWERLDRPCSLRVLEQALAFAQRRSQAFDPATAILVHGDPHPGNALRVLRDRPGAESGFVFVDPDGFVAEPAYDLGVVLRDWCRELAAGQAEALAQHYCASLADAGGVDETAVWEWGFLERVSTGLYLIHYGSQRQGRDFLDTAEMLV